MFFEVVCDKTIIYVGYLQACIAASMPMTPGNSLYLSKHTCSMSTLLPNNIICNFKLITRCNQCLCFNHDVPVWQWCL